MDESKLALNLRAGFIRGKLRACTGFVVVSGGAGGRIAAKLDPSAAWTAYPCVWCRGWHVGRPWTADELSGAAANSLTYVWAVRDSASCALLEVGDRDRVALLVRLLYAAMDANRAFVPR